jgi:hypothetical protein
MGTGITAGMAQTEEVTFEKQITSAGFMTVCVGWS